MTTTVDEVVLGLLANGSNARDIVEAILVVVLIVVLVQLEVLRRRNASGWRGNSVIVVAAVLAIAWMSVVTRRFFDLL